MVPQLSGGRLRPSCSSSSLSNSFDQSTCVVSGGAFGADVACVSEMGMLWRFHLRTLGCCGVGVAAMLRNFSAESCLWLEADAVTDI